MLATMGMAFPFVANAGTEYVIDFGSVATRTRGEGQ
jgi:hypothetical protein